MHWEKHWSEQARGLQLQADTAWEGGNVSETAELEIGEIKHKPPQ